MYKIRVPVFVAGKVPKKVRKRPPKVAGSLSVQSGPVVGQSWAAVGEVSPGLIWWQAG